MVDDPSAFLVRARRFVNPRAGLIRRVQEFRVESDDARIYVAATDVARTSRYGSPADCFGGNGGAGLTRELALAAALGETIERYACSVYFHDELVLSPYQNLPGRIVPADTLTFYSPAQYAQPDFPYQPFTISTPIRWVQATDLDDGEPTWYPAELVYVPYRHGAGEVPIASSVSTGLALAMTPAEATLAGLCEVVERDAVMIMWWNRLSAPEIQIAGCAWLERVVAERFTIPGVTFRLFNITTDVGIPSIFCIAEEAHAAGCALACGAAARPDPARAALKALIEAAQTRAWVRSLSRRNGPPDPDVGFGSITSFEDHVRLYSQPSMRRAVDFLTEHGRVVSLSSLPNLETGDAGATLRRCVAALQARGLEPIAIDLTPDDVAEQEIYAIKVAVPGMVELNGSHDLRCLGRARLYTAPVPMGYRDEPSTEAELNPFPHPFP